MSGQYRPPKKVWIDKVGWANIDPSSRISSGKFGTVLRQEVDGQILALKLFHEENDKRDAKILYMHGEVSNWKLPINVAHSLHLVRNKDQGNLIGFTMRLFDKSAREVSSLFKEDFRAQNNISIADGVRFFAQAFADLKVISKHLVIHDLSKRNLLHYLSKRVGQIYPGWIDWESWRIIGHDFGDPLVWTRFIADPLSIDPMTNRPIPGVNPTPGNDYYQLMHHLFNMIFGFTPYQGTHPKIYMDEERIARNVWVFDQAVMPPPDAKPVNILTTDIAKLFEDYFAKSERYEIPIELLKVYANSLAPCPNCGTEFPKSTKHCPVCSKVTPHYVAPIALVTELLNSTGQIIAYDFVNGKVVAVSLEKGQAFLYRRAGNGNTEKIMLTQLKTEDRGIRFQFISDNILAINRPLSEDPNKIDLWDTDKGQLLATASSVPFVGNHMLVPFRGSKGKLIRIAGSTLLSGEIRDNIGLIENRLPVTPSDGQSWFWAMQEKSRIFLVNVHFGQYFFELIEDGVRHELSIPNLEIKSGERLDDMSVRFGHKSVLLRMKSTQGFSEYIYTYVISIGKDVVLVNHSHEKVLVGPKIYPQTRQIAYGDSNDKYYIWYPTDQGVVEQEILGNTFEILTQTKNAITANWDLMHIGSGSGFGKHFLAKSSKLVKYVKLN